MDQLEGTVLLHVQTAAMAVDEHGRVGVFNPAAARVLGVSVEQVIGRSLDDLTQAGPALAALAECCPRHAGPASKRLAIKWQSPRRRENVLSATRRR